MTGSSMNSGTVATNTGCVEMDLGFIAYSGSFAYCL